MRLRDMWPGGPDVRDLTVRMDRPHLRDVPEVVLPESYELRTAWPGFEDAWARVMNASFDDERFTAAQCRESFTSKPDQFDPEGMFIVMHGDEPVASAFAWLDVPGEREIGRVHWVGTDPKHTRKGLARAVTVAVLRYLAGRGFARAFLETQPYRLPAIRLYLQLGFEPNAKGLANHETAWAEVARILGEGSPNASRTKRA
jgi:mycothiol synthase